MSTVPADPWHRRLSRLGQQRPVEIVLALVALTAAALWVYGGVQRALEQLAAQNLRTLVAGEATVIDAWVGEKRLNVQRWAAEIAGRPAVQRGRRVNRTWGPQEDQLRERHSTGDFGGDVTGR